MTVAEAMQVVLYDEFLGDSVYSVRDQAVGFDPTWEGSSWDHPRVMRFTEAVTVLEAAFPKIEKEQPSVT